MRESLKEAEKPNTYAFCIRHLAVASFVVNAAKQATAITIHLFNFIFSLFVLLSQISLQHFILCTTAQSADGFFFNLPYAFASKSVFRTNFFKCHLWLIDAIKGFNNIALTLIQILERIIDFLTQRIE